MRPSVHFSSGGGLGRVDAAFARSRSSLTTGQIVSRLWVTPGRSVHQREAISLRGANDWRRTTGAISPELRRPHLAPVGRAYAGLAV